MIGSYQNNRLLLINKISFYEMHSSFYKYVFCSLLECSEWEKVYADFHGVRYTRQHDGKLGRWEMYANTENQVPAGRLCVIMPT